jgi:hypothetical protein
MNDIEALNEEMKKEIDNSPALQMLFLRIKNIDNLLETRTCNCGKVVFASEYYVIYKDTGAGVCNECWLKHYYPYTPEFQGRGS